MYKLYIRNYIYIVHILYNNSNKSLLSPLVLYLLFKELEIMVILYYYSILKPRTILFLLFCKKDTLLIFLGIFSAKKAWEILGMSLAGDWVTKLLYALFYLIRIVVNLIGLLS